MPNREPETPVKDPVDVPITFGPAPVDERLVVAVATCVELFIGACTLFRDLAHKELMVVAAHRDYDPVGLDVLNEAHERLHTDPWFEALYDAFNQEEVQRAMFRPEQRGQGVFNALVPFVRDYLSRS